MNAAERAPFAEKFAEEIRDGKRDAERLRDDGSAEIIGDNAFANHAQYAAE